MVCCGGCAPRNQGEKKKGGREGEEGGGKMEKQGASHLCRMCSSHATMPCCCVRNGGCGVHPCPCQCVATSCVASHAIIMMSCLCASVFSSQPSLSACLSECVCVCAEGTPVQAAAAGEHTHPKKKRQRGCVRRKRGKQPAK